MKSDSKKHRIPGIPSDQETAFHEKMRKLYKEQGRLLDRHNGNDYYVAAKLPGNLYSDFYILCQQQGWSKSTGIKFAIDHLLKSLNA